MPFLSRNASVVESEQKAPFLTKEEIPVIVVGRSLQGPHAAAEHGLYSSAALHLAAHLEMRTHMAMPVMEAAAAMKSKGRKIHIGPVGTAPAEVFPELKDADAQGFALGFKDAPGGRELWIVGASAQSTEFAVRFFLMNYLGIREVLPYNEGLVVPESGHLDLPTELRVINPGPDYQLRVWSGTGGFNPAAWLGDTSKTERFQYHHNMSNIYDAAKFGATHPEYFPVKEGKPWVPEAQLKEAWQPTFSHPATAQRAVEYADEIFGSRPDMKSISLTVNDGLGYSEADMKLGQLLPDGKSNIADVYGRYVNAVALGLKKNWPDKYAAFLPYNLTTEAPSFPLADNAMVFLFREPKVEYAKWEGKAKHFGLYLWLYGMDWVIPNHWPHMMQDCLKWTRAHGGIAFKGEAYPAWIQDGPKLWVLNNLLWNTDADVDALLRDYFEHTYGLEAAPSVARYFAQAEQIYERRRTPEEYQVTLLRPGEKQFANVKQGDIDQMRDALDEARRVIQGEANVKRLEMLERCFHVTDLYWQQYAILGKLESAPVTSMDVADSLLKGAADFYALQATTESYWKKEILTSAPFCVFGNAPGKVVPAQVDPQFKWANFDAALQSACSGITKFLTASEHLSKGDASAWWDRAAKVQPAILAYAKSERLALLGSDLPLKNQLSNGSFEEPPPVEKAANGHRHIARDWEEYQNRMVNATVSLDSSVRHDGKVSLTAKGLTDISGVYRPLALPNHTRYRLSFWYRTSPETRHIQVTLGMGGKQIPLTFLPVSEWTRVEHIFLLDAPGLERSGISLLLGLRHGGSEKSQAWFDDVRVEMLAPEGVELTGR